MKVSELSGALLDLWVARVSDEAVPLINNRGVCSVIVAYEGYEAGTRRVDYRPSEDWAIAGPIIERQGINLLKFDHVEQPWVAVIR